MEATVCAKQSRARGGIVKDWKQIKYPEKALEILRTARHINQRAAVELAVSLTGPRPPELPDRSYLIRDGKGRFRKVRVFASPTVEREPGFYRIGRRSTGFSKWLKRL